MKNLFKIILPIFLIIALLTSCSLPSEKEIEGFLSDIASSIEEEIKEELSDTEEETEVEAPIETGEEEIGEGDLLTIQFVDVGQADAALVECGGEYLLIDGGNRGDSDILYAILKRKGITHLDYVVGTHAHEDHVGGIAGALEACTSVGTVFSPVTEYNSKTFENFKKAAEEKSNGLTVPTVGDEFYVGSAKVKILGPVKDYDEPNNTSIVLKITFGKTSFLFTGDMEHDAEIDLLESGVNVSADVLKVGHHGSGTSTSYRFLREVAPKYGIISVGTGNTYGHPHDEALSRLRDADVEFYRTDEVGDVFCTSNGYNISFTTKKY